MKQRVSEYLMTEHNINAEEDINSSSARN